MLSVKLHQHIKHFSINNKRSNLNLWLNMFDFLVLKLVVGSFIISNNQAQYHNKAIFDNVSRELKLYTIIGKEKQ